MLLATVIIRKSVTSGFDWVAFSSMKWLDYTVVFLGGSPVSMLSFFLSVYQYFMEYQFLTCYDAVNGCFVKIPFTAVTVQHPSAHQLLAILLLLLLTNCSNLTDGKTHTTGLGVTITEHSRALMEHKQSIPEHYEVDIWNCIHTPFMLICLNLFVCSKFSKMSLSYLTKVSKSNRYNWGTWLIYKCNFYLIDLLIYYLFNLLIYYFFWIF